MTGYVVDAGPVLLFKRLLGGGGQAAATGEERHRGFATAQ